VKKIIFHIVLAVISFLPVIGGQQPGVHINEVMYSNKQTLHLGNDRTPDWIELYNSSDQAVNLKKWSITDNPDKADKYVFSEIWINPGEFLLIYAADREKADSGNSIFTSFELKANEEPVILYNNRKELIDSVYSPCVPQDHSLGRKNDTGELVVFSSPTPGRSNSNATIISIDFKKDIIDASQTSGFYEDEFNLTLSPGNPENMIYYSLDGSEPDEKSNRYSSPLFIHNRTADENMYSAIPYTEGAYVPKNNVFKGTVVRARVYADGCPVSDEIVRTYFVNKSIKERYPVPVISLTTDPDNFFDDDEGIYVFGNNFNCLKRGKEWEREVHFDYFSPKGELLVSQNVGARTHGRGSRMGAQKSLKIYAREEYGKDVIEYKFFENRDIDRYKTLIIRSTAPDWSNTMFTDELSHSLVRNMDIDYMEYQPVVVFFNGEYWGVHNLRERQDEYYLKNEFTDVEKTDIISYERYVGPVAEEGDRVDYDNLVDYIATHDLSLEEYYDDVKRLIDVDNLIDYFVAQLYFANTDFPDLNQRMWKTDNDDSRWRWYFFDCDGCMWRVNYDLMYQYSNVNDEYLTFPEWSLVLFKKLLTNNEFRARFYQRFINVLNEDLSTHNVLSQIDEFEKEYEPLINEHIARWKEPADYNTWMKNVDELRGFALQRPAEVIHQLRENMGVPFVIRKDEYNKSLSVDFPDKINIPVTVKILDTTGRLISTSEMNAGSNTIDISENLPTGIYFVQVVYGDLNFASKYLNL
jgi:hypothetical protein